MSTRLKMLALSLPTLLAFAASAGAQITVTAPNARTVVTAANDWATRTFQDPQDMNERTDLGWFVNSVDSPSANLTNVQFSSGVFSGITQSGGANFFILETGNTGSARLGRTGDNYPIDANTYTMVAVRMRLAGTGVADITTSSSAWSTSSAAFFRWWPKTIYDSDQTAAGSFFTFSGWQIYILNLPSIPIALGTTPWSGTIRTLRFDPTFVAGAELDVDWVRVVASATPYTITWSSAGAVDIYLDSDTDYSNGNLGNIIQVNNQSSRNRTGGSYTFQASALAPGDYYVEICPAGMDPTTNSCTYSSGYYHVNAAPTLTLTSPSEEGSSDDFATVQLNNAWDMNATSDIDYSLNINGLSVDTAFPAENEAGASLGNIRVLKGTSIAPPNAGWGDPVLYPLWFTGDGGRGKYNTIDTSRYRILTLEMGLEGARDINGGSIARIIYKNRGEQYENISQDLVINSRAGANVVNKIIADMAALPMEDSTQNPPAGCYPCSGTGWTGIVDAFRLDPHELTPASQFWVKRIKLAAFEHAGTAAPVYRIRWNYADPDGGGTPTMTLSYNTTKSTSGLTTIAVVNPSTTTYYDWDTSGLAESYYIYASFSDGLNSNSTWSRWPIVVDPIWVALPRMVLDRTALYFDGTNNGAIMTSPQDVRINLTGTSAVSWSVNTTDTQNLVDIKNAAGTSVTPPLAGAGAGAFKVGIRNRTDLPNNLYGELGVVEVTATGVSNSPQYVRSWIKMHDNGTTQPPVGTLELPGEGAAVSGTFAVSGWALDDIEVTKVEVWRQPYPTEAWPTVYYDGGATPRNGKVFIGYGTFVEDARPDVAAAAPTWPYNYRAGWGYMMLSRGVIWDGHGPFTLYAIAVDREGHVAQIGTNTITINNAVVTRPFGAIDLPDQGGTIASYYANTGWVLAAPGRNIPSTGLEVYLDSVFVAYGGCMQPRSDLTGAFPGFDASQAVRCWEFNAANYPNGLHHIAWLARDNTGEQDGVGGRFFRIFNAGTSSASAAGLDGTRLAAAGITFSQFGRPVDDLRVPLAASPVRAALAWSRAPRMQPVGRGAEGPTVEMSNSDRLVLQVPGTPGRTVSYAAYQVVNGELRGLPIGASFDALRGILYWNPPAGFKGVYDFAFVRSTVGGDADKSFVRVNVGKRLAPLFAVRAVTPTPVRRAGPLSAPRSPGSR